MVLRGATEEEVVVGQRYRQNSVFSYYTGVETPGAFLVLLPDELPASAGNKAALGDTRELLFLPDRNPVGEVWTGEKWGPGEATETLTGITKVLPYSALWAMLTGWLRRVPVIYTVAPFGEAAKLTRGYALIQKISELAPITQFRDVSRTMRLQRLVKSPAELAKLETAIRITEVGQRVAQELITQGTGRYEYEVEAKILEAFRSQGATLAFPAIVGAGARATVLHYEENDGKMNEGDLVVVDIGGEMGRLQRRPDPHLCRRRR